jgi:hypothetical protein
MAFIILSPDNIAIHREETYPNIDVAKQRFDDWKKQYEAQGHYSSSKGKILPQDLESYCTLVELDK